MNTGSTPSANHPLVGVWRTEDRDSRAEFSVACTDGAFVVTGRDTDDNEAFEITEVRWDGQVLHFRSRMPTTDHGVENMMEALPDGSCRFRYTLTERWTRSDLTTECI